MKEKTRLIIGAVVILAVVSTLALYLTSNKSIDLLELVGIVIVPLLLVFGAAYILWRKAESMKSGLPMEDEFSKKVSYRAGYYAYMVSIYVALAGMFFELEGHLVGAAVILIPAVVFMGSHVYLERAGVRE
jgi:purine-cytosine permease-like protein